MRSQVKGWWGKPTDDVREKVSGQFDKLISLLQEKYGYTREAAEEEFNRRIKDVEKKVDKA
jgi:uncharacterized protein YjbJ (UPF0337 family)